MIRRFISSNKTKFSLKKLPNNPILPIKSENGQSSTSQFFVDTRTTFAIGGNGGDGLVSFMHLKGNEFAGPDGGDGGNGGHVIFQVQSGLKSLNQIKSKYTADNGENGRAYHMRGKNGKHLVVNIPPGTILRDDTGELLVELDNEKISTFVAARGGPGGKGNYYFLANDNKKPKQFEPGHKGEQKIYHMELKIIADAALIGFPNVGKSSILNALTRARAKVGDYAFTTVHPQVGVIEYADYVQISIADLPGILPDLKRGFGTRYLGHLEKCSILVIVLDVSSNCLNHPIEQYTNIINGIAFFDDTILKYKKKIVVANKVENLEENDERLDQLRQHLDLKNDNSPIIPMSAQKRINLSKFLKLLRYVHKQ